MKVRYPGPSVTDAEAQRTPQTFPGGLHLAVGINEVETRAGAALIAAGTVATVSPEEAAAHDQRQLTLARAGLRAAAAARRAAAAAAQAARAAARREAAKTVDPLPEPTPRPAEAKADKPKK